MHATGAIQVRHSRNRHIRHATVIDRLLLGVGVVHAQFGGLLQQPFQIGLKLFVVIHGAHGDTHDVGQLMQQDIHDEIFMMQLPRAAAQTQHNPVAFVDRVTRHVGLVKPSLGQLLVMPFAHHAAETRVVGKGLDHVGQQGINVRTEAGQQGRGPMRIG